MDERMTEFHALFAGFMAGSAAKQYLAEIDVDLIDLDGNHTGYFYATHHETGERLLVRFDPVPRCPGCDTYAVWSFGDEMVDGGHWVTAHQIDCSWMADPQSECYG